MAEENLPEELPSRPQSGFAKPDKPRLDKNGRPLRGFTTPEYHANHWTPERREQKRLHVQRLIEEGKFGAANGFHRRKAKKAQEILAEHYQAQADKVIGKLDAMLDSKDKRLQLEAIREYSKAEDWAVRNSREDEKEFRKMTGEQLDERLLELMGDALGLDFSILELNGNGNGEEIIDGEVVEDVGD